MKFFSLNSIRNKLVLLILFTVAPCLAILVYSGIEQRRHLIETAQADVLLLAHSLAEAQKTITLSTRQILTTLAQIPTIQTMDPKASSAILRSVLQNNPDYNNFGLVDLKGNVIASSKPFTETNLADRKHFKEALQKKNFAVGEYIVTRVGTTNPAFAFAYPILDGEGSPQGVLTASLKLNVFSRFYDVSRLPGRSFLAITDYKGIRLFYYPAQKDTNPLGKPIQATAWNMASTGEEEGIFFSSGSDSLRRVLAYVRIPLPHEDSPYLYAWVGIPESHILEPANAILIRNVLLLLLTTGISIFISWLIGKKTFLAPIQHLVLLTKKFAQGALTTRSELSPHAGELGALTTAFHDMAESLKRSRKDLEESDQRFKTIADFAYDWECWISQDGQFIYSSPSSERITGYTQAEITADPQLVCTMVKAEYIAQVRRHCFTEIKEDAPDSTMEYPIVKKSGEEVWLEHNCRPVYDAAGKYAGRRSSNRDITDRKRSEKANIHLQEQLVQSQKIESVGRLAGGVAHDFNNMLGVILGHAELAQKQLAITEPLFFNLEEIRKAAQHSADITRQLLAFARKQTIAPQIIDLNESVAGMLSMLRRLIGEDIDLAWLPARSLGAVNMDPSQLDQILANLCVNARDAIADTGKVTIETDNVAFDAAYCQIHAGFVPGEFVMLAVSDNGCGMDERTKSHLFEPFFTTKEMNKGTGLGLAMIYGIVKQNNGFINVYSEPDQGTTFKIYLPRHEASAAPRSEEDPADMVAHGDEVILLVEDEQMILDMTTRVLEFHGYQVLPAATPQEAIRLAQKHTGQLHLLLTDVVMPEMNGRNLADTLVSLRPQLKCLFMSGYTANVIAHQGVLDEGVHFIQKPFSLHNLTVKIREVLDTD